ncbi:MAG: hypothetical protein IJ224_06845 [Lachnospiraceae bacterium]|nr:hypothetical protein [Lachnospiraceae bacterium]
MSQADNVFAEKQDYLIEIREEVMKRDAMAAELEKMRTYQKKITKNIASEDKSISDEIASTIKKRKQDLSDIYDERIDDNRSRRKKVEAKRGKKKNEQMNERIQDETKDIRDDSRELEVEMKTILKKNKVSSFCASKLFYTMFMPKGTDEIIAMLFEFLVFFAGIPAVVMLIFKKAVLSHKKDINMAFWCTLIAAIVFIILLVIYFMIYSSVKMRNIEVLKETRAIRDRIKANDKHIDAIKNSISKDQDESYYNLSSYDKKLKELDKEADSISDEKQDALKLFESDTKNIITDEINQRRLPELERLKDEKKELEKKIAQGEKKYSEMVLYISNKYAKYIGEDLCKEDKLSDLIALMEEGQADTVSEAINLYKGQKSSR